MLSGCTPKNGGQRKKKVLQPDCGPQGRAIEVLFQVPIQVAAAAAAAWVGLKEFVGTRNNLVVLVLISEGPALVDLRGGHGVCGAGCGQEGHW